MIEYTFAHMGINCANAEEARKGAALLEALFGLTVREGNSSVFAGKDVELMKSPYLGKNGHIAIGTPNVAAAVAVHLMGKKLLSEAAKHSGRPVPDDGNSRNK